MFNFFRRKSKSQPYYVDFSTVGVDIHSHLLPGVDDGAKDLVNSVQMIDDLRELGFKKLITTPHTYKAYYPNTTEGLRESHQTVIGELKRQHLDFTFDFASEYYMDELFSSRLSSGDILTLDGKHVLVEMSFMGEMPNLHNVLFDIQTSGFVPILAHPERYLYLGPTAKRFKDLKERGFLLQLNLLSLTGHYGPEVKSLAETILNAGLYDFAGTDCHNQGHIDKLRTLTENKGGKDISSSFNNSIFL